MGKTNIMTISNVWSKILVVNMKIICLDYHINSSSSITMDIIQDIGYIVYIVIIIQ
jgi:hypothetical protein